MRGANHITHIVTKPWETAAVFLGSFFILSVFLNLIDFVPEAPTVDTASEKSAPTTQAPVVTVSQVAALHERNLNLIAGPAPAVTQASESGILPTRVVIEKVGVDTPVSNPRSTTLASLDNALLTGAVRFPGTASLDTQGSVVIFGHQSYLPVVHNKAFKAFNDLQKLTQGDTISVYSGNTEYRYAVRSVMLVTTDYGSIPLETVGRTLTLVTCNSLGEKEERYIVKADLIGTFTN